MAVKASASVTIFHVTDGEDGANGIDFSQGKMLYTDPSFAAGENSVRVYNNSGGGTVTITRAEKSSDNPMSDTGYELVIENTGTASPECGGFCFGNKSRANAVFIYRIIAKIPEGRSIVFASNNTGNSPERIWRTSNAGEGYYREYIFSVRCGATGTFGNTGYFYINGSVGSTDSPVTWNVAYATCFDMTNESDVSVAIKSSTTLYYASNSGATYPSQPTAAVTTSSATKYDAWNLTLPTYSTSYPYLYICTQNVTNGGVYSWTAVEPSTYSNNIAALDGRISTNTSSISSTDGTVSLIADRVTVTEAGVLENKTWIEETGSALSSTVSAIQGDYQKSSTLKQDINSLSFFLSEETTNVSKSYLFITATGSSDCYWVKLGTLVSGGDATNFHIEVLTGNGFNAESSQNSNLIIDIKDGWQSTQAAASSFGVSVTRQYCETAQVRVMATAHNTCDVWVYLPWDYNTGTYTISGIYSSWTAIGTAQGSEPSASDSYVSQEVAYRVNAENAEKTATNYLVFDSTNGLQVGNYTSGSWSGTRAQITGDAFKILDANGTDRATYSADYLRIGNYSTNSVYIDSNVFTFENNGYHKLILGDGYAQIGNENTYNTYIDSSGMSIRNGSTELASFASNAVYLGINSEFSTLNLGDGAFKIVVRQTNNYVTNGTIVSASNGIYVTSDVRADSFAANERVSAKSLAVDCSIINSSSATIYGTLTVYDADLPYNGTYDNRTVAICAHATSEEAQVVAYNENADNRIYLFANSSNIGLYSNYGFMLKYDGIGAYLGPNCSLGIYSTSAVVYGNSSGEAQVVAEYSSGNSAYIFASATDSGLCAYRNGTFYGLIAYSGTNNRMELWSPLYGEWDIKIGAAYANTYRIAVYNSLNNAYALVNSSGNAGVYHNSETGPAAGWIVYMDTSGTIHVPSSSDKRYKNYICDVTEEEASALLAEVNPIVFTYKSDSVGNEVSEGFYAQDVRDVLIRHGIGYRSYLRINTVDDGEESQDIYDLSYNEDLVKYGLDYQKFVPVLWKGWQIHKTEIDELKAENEELRAQIEDLALEIATLKKNMEEANYA